MGIVQAMVKRAQALPEMRRLEPGGGSMRPAPASDAGGRPESAASGTATRTVSSVRMASWRPG